MYDDIKSIELHIGFLLYSKELVSPKGKSLIVGLSFHGKDLASDYLEVSDFVATLESALQNKLGYKMLAKCGDYEVFGTKKDDEYFVCLKNIFFEDTFYFNILEVRMIAKKLNMLLNASYKKF